MPPAKPAGKPETQPEAKATESKPAAPADAGKDAAAVGQSAAVQPVKPQQCQDFPSRWVNLLWGKVPLEVMRRDYPMLFACSAFKKFIGQ